MVDSINTAIRLMCKAHKHGRLGMASDITVAPGVARGITILGENEDPDAISIVRALLDGTDGARDEAIAWLEAKESAL